MRVHLISPNDNWILEKIASKLMEINGLDIQMSNSQEINYEADLNYFVNWCYWKILYPELDKPEGTLVFFTHFDSHSEKYMDVLDKADHIAVMSLHGKEVLLNKNIAYEKIHVVEGFGTLDDLPYRKIKLGISGRPKADGRKGDDVLIKLSEHLDAEIFEFVFENDSWESVGMKMNDDNGMFSGSPIIRENFWNSIDYYLSPSHSEGGPMDMLNAVKCGIPIISELIGFAPELCTSEDIIYKDYEDLLLNLQFIQKAKLDKIAKMKRHTWDNFKDWHLKLFEEINAS